jgi:putative Mn2+ efflux pump MntP
VGLPAFFFLFTALEFAMSYFEIFALAVALSLDAFAVAVCTACGLARVRLGHYVRLALAFGFFQAAMPVIGWYCGLTIRSFIEAWDHWFAFALLVWVGGNMLREGLQKADCGNHTGQNRDATYGLPLLVMAVATSIDALAVGFSFSLLHMSIWIPALMIGVVCACITAAGVLCGKIIANAAALGKKAEIVGGLTLLAIGIKILFEHDALALLGL